MNPETEVRTMLTSPELELLTAAVDGELSPDHTLAFRRLLSAKPEATAVFRAMERDAAKLRAATLLPIPVSQVVPVLARIGSKAQPRRVRGAPTRRMLVLQYAVAASVFFTLCSASFWVFTARDRLEQDKVQINRLPVVDPTNAAPERDSVAVAHGMPKPQQPKLPSVPEEAPLPKDYAIVQKPVDTELAPAPRSAIGDVVGSGIIENPKPLTEIRLRLPFLTEAMEFDSLEVQARLKQELAQDPAFRLDLFSKNPATALELLQTAAKQTGVAISVDARTQELLNKKVPISVAIYLEGLTATELAPFFGGIGKQLQNAPKPVPIGMSHLLPIGTADLRDLKEILGVDLSPQRTGRVGIVEPKSVVADTLGKVTNSVKRVGEKAGIVIAYLPPNLRTPSAQSKEIKAFLDTRSERKPGTVPLLIVLRPQG